MNKDLNSGTYSGTEVVHLTRRSCMQCLTHYIPLSSFEDSPCGSNSIFHQLNLHGNIGQLDCWYFPEIAWDYNGLIKVRTNVFPKDSTNLFIFHNKK